jgi:hypothetical protein
MTDEFVDEPEHFALKYVLTRQVIDTLLCEEEYSRRIAAQLMAVISPCRKKSYQKSSKSKNPPSPYYSFINLRGANDLSSDLSDRLSQELEERAWKVSPKERAAVLDYAIQDFQPAYDDIIARFRILQKCDPVSDIWKEQLRFAWNSSERALKDMNFMKMLSPEVNPLHPSLSYERMSAGLNDIREKLRIVQAFPQSYKQRIALYNRMKDAVHFEAYEVAARLRDEMAHLSND